MRFRLSESLKGVAMDDRDIVERNEKELVGLVRTAARGGITRRQFVERGLILGLSAGALGMLLAACGDEENGAGGAGATMPPMDETKPETLTLYNWTDYMDPEILGQFRQLEGIKVDETYFASNEEMLAKLRGGGTGYDVMVPSDYMVAILRKSELLQPIDLSYIPNFEYVGDRFRRPNYDNPDEQDGLKYSVPYFYGTTGYAVRTDNAGDGQTDWSPLFDPANRGRINMLDDERECIGASLKSLGYSANTTEQGELDRARDKLIEQKPLVSTYDSVNMRRSIVQGVPYGMCWDGDALLAIDTMGGDEQARERVLYVRPSEGFVRWTDNLVIPESSDKRYGAHLLINYLTDPRISAQNANWIWYLSAVPASHEFTDEFALSLEPTEEELALSEQLNDVGEFTTQYQQAWRQVKTA
jgi:spermidine/putrescine transport system substrate-binding protein